jgi:hypothetical protein
MMPGWQRAFVLATCALIGGAAAYAACDWGGWPRVTLLPATGQITVRPPPGALSIPFLGIVAWGVGGGACGVVVGALLCHRSMFGRSRWSDRSLQLFGAWAITAVLLAGSYYTWNLWPW